MVLARRSSRRWSLRDCDSRKYDERASVQPASGIWASEYVRGVSSISGELAGGMAGFACGNYGSGDDSGGLCILVFKAPLGRTVLGSSTV